MCSIGDNWLKNQSYLDVRRKDINSLTNKYIQISNKVLELESGGLDSNSSRELADLNTKIYNLQDRLFENNLNNLEHIKSQKENISKKNNSININKGMIENVKNNILSTEDINKLRDNRVASSKKNTDNIEKYYTVYIILILVLFVVQVVLIISLK